MAGNFIEGDVLSGKARCRGQCDAMSDPIGKVDGPLESLHATQTAANNGCPFCYTEVFGEPFLTAHPILNLRLGKLATPGLSRVGVDGIGS